MQLPVAMAVLEHSASNKRPGCQRPGPSGPPSHRCCWHPSRKGLPVIWKIHKPCMAATVRTKALISLMPQLPKLWQHPKWGLLLLPVSSVSLLFSSQRMNTSSWQIPPSHSVPLGMEMEMCANPSSASHTSSWVCSPGPSKTLVHKAWFI